MRFLCLRVDSMLKTKVEIIYQNDDIIVINKPAGVSVTKDRTGALQLVDILTGKLGPKITGELRLVHRLDKDASGVMILAKNKQTQTRFSGYFEKGLIKKTYLALVSGVPATQQGIIDAPLIRNRRNSALMCIAAKKGKKAVTDWQVLADFGSVALLAVRPLTGRTHQIRVHLSSIGLPLAIDPLYGAKQPLFLSDFKTDYRLAKDKTETPLIERLTLHAYQIELPHFASSIDNRQSKIESYFVASLDKKFAATIKMLAKYNSKGLNSFLNPDDFSKILNVERLY